MKIATVHIHNFRSIIDEHFRLFDFNLLVGANNAGKSSCVDALRFFFSNTDLSNKLDSPTGIHVLGKDESWVQLSFTSECNSEESTLRELVPYGASAIRRYLKCVNGKSEFRAVDSNGNALGAKITGVPEKLRELFGDIVYIPTSNDITDFTKLTGPSTFRDVALELMNSALEVESIKSYNELKRAIEAFSRSFNESSAVMEFKRRMEEQLGQWGCGVDINLTSPQNVAEIVKNMMSLKIVDTMSGNDREVSTQGSGFSRQFIFRLLKTCSEMKQKKASGDRSLKRRQILLFEEPEAFLHSEQQAELARELRSLADNGYQVVCTTHSSQFLSTNFDDFKSVIRLHKKDGRTKIAQVTEDDLSTFLSDTPTGPNVTLTGEETEVKYLLLLNPNRCGAFFSDNVLLVEGTTEEVLINTMLSDGTLTLPHGAFVLECLGKYNMPRLMFLLDKFGISHSVLLDKDESSDQQKWNDYILRNKTKRTRAIKFLDPDLERCLGLPKFKGDNWKKPQSILMKYKGKIIPTQNIEKFKGLVESLCAK